MLRTNSSPPSGWGANVSLCCWQTSTPLSLPLFTTHSTEGSLFCMLPVGFETSWEAGQGSGLLGGTWVPPTHKMKKSYQKVFPLILHLPLSSWHTRISEAGSAKFLPWTEMQPKKEMEEIGYIMIFWAALLSGPQTLGCTLENQYLHKSNGKRIKRQVEHRCGGVWMHNYLQLFPAFERKI